jgi:carbonic anhydrase
MPTLASSTIFALFLGSTLTATSLAAETFSYDPNSPVGPANWGSLEGSFCAGSAQSGIDVPTGACNEVNVDYMFKVRGRVVMVILQSCRPGVCCALSTVNDALDS